MLYVLKFAKDVIERINKTPSRLWHQQQNHGMNPSFRNENNCLNVQTGAQQIVRFHMVFFPVKKCHMQEIYVNFNFPKCSDEHVLQVNLHHMTFFTGDHPLHIAWIKIPTVTRQQILQRGHFLLNKRGHSEANHCHPHGNHLERQHGWQHLLIESAKCAKCVPWAAAMFCTKTLSPHHWQFKGNGWKWMEMLT